MVFFRKGGRGIVFFLLGMYIVMKKGRKKGGINSSVESRKEGERNR